MSTDPIQSIRVAARLAERFRALLATGTTDFSDLELAIGEAQQIYPEIWRHLIDARNVLAGRGRDVSMFDHLQRLQITQLGVTDIDVSRELDYAALLVGRIHVRETKTATFNLAGYRAAMEACRALMAAMPEVDWVAIEKAEDAVIAEAGSLRTRRWLNIAKAVAIVAVLAGASVLVVKLVRSAGDTPSPDERRAAERRDEEDGIRSRARERDREIQELLGRYRLTCDRAVLPALTARLKEASRLPEVRRLESEPCVIVPPTCDTETKSAITAGIAQSFSIARDDSLRVQCEGVRTGTPGAPVPGLAIGVTGKRLDGTPQMLRGIVASDGTGQIVKLRPDAMTLVGVADLDSDNIDELVFVTSTALIVSRVRGGEFEDIFGPPIAGACPADVNVEADFRAGRTGGRKMVVLTVPPDVKDEDCLAPGRHFLALDQGQLAEMP